MQKKSFDIDVAANLISVAEHGPFELWPVLYSLREPLADCSKTIRQHGNRDDDASQAMTESAGQLREELIGIAFVVCQTWIGAVAASVKKIHGAMTRDTRKRMPPTGKNKFQIMRYQNSKVGESERCQIEVIHHYANYWKHRADWPGDYEQLKDAQKNTADALADIGALNKKTLNANVNMLGLSVKNDSSILDELETCCQEWKLSLFDSYKKVL